MIASTDPNAVIVIGEDDPGHARLIEKNLRRAGLRNKILRFEDGQAVLDYLLRRESGRPVKDALCWLVLDIRMPKIDGIEVLRRVRMDPALRDIRVSMLSTTDDPREIARCFALGCSNYLVKPVDYEKFCEVVIELGISIAQARGTNARSTN